MARFFGAVGYGEQTETSPGVFQDVITEYNYYGDIVQNIRRYGPDDKINSDISVSNLISILADAYAREHFHAMRYVSWSGVLWTVQTVEVQNPRLLLRLGEVYNGPTP